jgi:hypothetical protein
MSKNTTQIKAAVVREKGGPFNVETLTLEGPRRGEVLVKIVATGMWDRSRIRQRFRSFDEQRLGSCSRHVDEIVYLSVLFSRRR